MPVILNSWKEIAAYIGRGVRTAQRWERDLALPVRRPRGKDRSAVIAVPSEIDAWLRTCPTHDLVDKKRLAETPVILPPWEKTYHATRQLGSVAEPLQDRTRKLKAGIQRPAVLVQKLKHRGVAGNGF